MASNGFGSEDQRRSCDTLPDHADLQGNRCRSYDCSLHNQPVFIGVHWMALNISAVNDELIP